MAELEMLPAWAGRLAEASPPPQPPTPPRRYATDGTAADNGVNGGDDGGNGDGPAATANGHGPPAVLTGQPPLPSGEHRIEPAAATTSELPVVSIPFEDETAAADAETVPAPQPPVPAVDPLLDTVEAPSDDAIVDAELVEEPEDAEVGLVSGPDDELAEIEDDDEIEDEIGPDVEIGPDPADWEGAPADDGEAPRGEGLLDEGRQPPPGHAYLDEIVYEPDEIELLEDTDPIGIAPSVDLPVVTATPTADAGRDDGQARPSERDRPVLRVLSLLALALLVVAAGVAAGYLFVALSGS